MKGNLTMSWTYPTNETLSAYVGREEGKPWPACAWPGGYAITYVADDGKNICADCMNDPSCPTHFHADDPTQDGWRIDGAMAFGVDADYPLDADERCAHCNAVICGTEGS
jgi:hypothetical protein